MKFMKLGSKPDAFETDGDGIRYITSDLASDITIIVEDVKFYLHKFPLISKSNRMQNMVAEANGKNTDEIHIVEFPGGPKAFETCAKFCYGMIVTLNAYNVAATRCAAEHLEMTEEIEGGNLIYKIEVFLKTSIFRSWKDSIIVLQTAKFLLPWSEDLKVISRCIDSIVSKISIDTKIVNWSYTYSRRLETEDGKIERPLHSFVPKDWWVEDISELDIDLYKQVMVGIKSKGRVPGKVVGEALKFYALKWLPESIDSMISEENTQRNMSLVETIIWLLQSDRNITCSCSFLLKFLKISILVGIDEVLREELLKRISLQLDEASVKDLLILSQSPNDTIYDVDLVRTILNQFAMRAHSLRKVDTSKQNLVLGHGPWLNVGKLIDGYLAEIAHDQKLSLSTFIDLSEEIPDWARLSHDGLYKAIDIYLMEHQELTKAEKKRVCQLMDIKKLSMEASLHAAQNDRLPLRVVVQILVFEQMKAAARSTNPSQSNLLDSSISRTTNTDEDDNCKSLTRRIENMKFNDLRHPQIEETKKKSKSRGGVLVSSRSMRIFDKFWVGKSQVEHRNSETSGSSISPTSLIPGEVKSSGSSSRHRRYSIS